jgi:hypothetical protein
MSGLTDSHPTIDKSAANTMKLGNILNDVTFISPPISPPPASNKAYVDEGLMLSRQDETTYIIHSSAPSSPTSSEGELDIWRFLKTVSECLDLDDLDLPTSPCRSGYEEEEDEVLEDELVLRKQVLWLYGNIAQKEDREELEKRREEAVFKELMERDVKDDEIVDTDMAEISTVQSEEVGGVDAVDTKMQEDRVLQDMSMMEDKIVLENGEVSLSEQE